MCKTIISTAYIFKSEVRYSWLCPHSPARESVIFLGLPGEKSFLCFPCHSLGGSSVTAWSSPWGPGSPTTPSQAAFMSLPSLAGLWGPGESQREVSLGRLLCEPDLPGAGLHELHSLPALHRGQREMSPPGALRHGLALSLYIVYIETVIYISACLKYCINVKLSTGEG